MPTKSLPASPNLAHLRNQAKDIRRALASQSAEAAQRVREFHPRYQASTDQQIFGSPFSLADAQLTIAREYGFRSWNRLRSQVGEPNAHLPYRERIPDPDFVEALDLLDAGDAEGLRHFLKSHPRVASMRVEFEGGNYFREPALLEFIAENPIRNGKLPSNIAGVASVILEAGADQRSKDSALGWIASGRVPRECGVQQELIDLLCSAGADPNAALLAALSHGEFDAAEALLRGGAQETLPAAAALGRTATANGLLEKSSSLERHQALALAAQFGRTEVLKMLLDAGEDPNRYNPPGLHSHSTPLHQAALRGSVESVKALVDAGARLDVVDILFKSTPLGWAEYGNQEETAQFLRTLV